MREGIPDTEEKAYFSSYTDSLEKGIEVHCVCDASKDELGCVLMQSERVVAYGSRQLKNYE